MTSVCVCVLALRDGGWLPPTNPLRLGRSIPPGERWPYSGLHNNASRGDWSVRMRTDWLAGHRREGWREREHLWWLHHLAHSGRILVGNMLDITSASCSPST